MLNYRIDGSQKMDRLFSRLAQAENWTKTKDFHLSCNLTFLGRKIKSISVSKSFSVSISRGSKTGGGGGWPMKVHIQHLF